MNEPYQRFTELEVWKKARAFKVEIYGLVKQFPSEEKFRLTDQLIRSVRSIPTNISEGHGRFTYKDQLNFCVIARGSLSETYNHIIDAFDCNYIDSERLKQLESNVVSVERLLNGYITFLRNQLKN
jgi:four helix bundle protein